MQFESEKSAFAEATSRQSSSWLFQAVTGILLIVIVFLHMFFQHFQQGELLNATEVVLHVTNPVIFILEILFVIFVTYHAMLGLRAIIFDVVLSETTRRKVNVGLTVLGLITAVYGVILAWLIQSQILA